MTFSNLKRGPLCTHKGCTQLQGWLPPDRSKPTRAFKNPKDGTTATISYPSKRDELCYYHRWKVEKAKEEEQARFGTPVVGRKSGIVILGQMELRKYYGEEWERLL